MQELDLQKVIKNNQPEIPAFFNLLKPTDTSVKVTITIYVSYKYSEYASYKYSDCENLLANNLIIILKNQLKIKKFQNSFKVASSL